MWQEGKSRVEERIFFVVVVVIDNHFTPTGIK